MYFWFPCSRCWQRKYCREYKCIGPSNLQTQYQNVRVIIWAYPCVYGAIFCQVMFHGLCRGLLLRSNLDMAKRQDSVRIPRSACALQNASAVENRQLLRGNHPTHCGRVAGSSCSPVLAASQLLRRANLTIMKSDQSNILLLMRLRTSSALLFCITELVLQARPVQKKLGKTTSAILGS